MKAIIFGVLMLVVSTSAAEHQINCSQFGDHYVPVDSVPQVTVFNGNMTACPTGRCARRRPQLKCTDTHSSETAQSIVEARCDLQSDMSYACMFTNKNGRLVHVVAYQADFNEVAKHKPECVLKDSFYVEYSTDEERFDMLIERTLMFTSILLDIVLIFGCALACCFGAWCCGGRS